MTPSQKIKYYERVLELMQGQVFFVQDADGVLRRWYPPREVIPQETKS